MLSTKRLTPILLIVVFLLACLFFLNSPVGTFQTDPHPKTVPVAGDPVALAPAGQSAAPAKPSPVKPAPPTTPAVAVSYDKLTPPTVGCESIVHDLQEKLLSEYQEILKGIRYVNVWGYLGALHTLPLLTLHCRSN